jgi:uncharacterized membrane protein YgaE (UPF0421/DUF939 family)
MNDIYIQRILYFRLGDEMKIGFRIIKTAVGAGIAIALAKWLGLAFFTTAGMLTILCIKETKKRSIHSALEKFIASVVGGLFSAAFFQFCGFHPWVITLILLTLIPILVKIQAKDSVATSSVVILHLYMFNEITPSILLNELGIITVGIGMALIMNVVMPSAEKDLKVYQERLEKNYKKIFNEFVVYLRCGESDWDGKEIIETGELIKEAKDLALRDIENSFRATENHYFHYFEMREKQWEIIQRIMPLVSSLDQTYPQSHKIADFLEQLAKGIHPGNTVDFHLDRLQEMRKEFKASPLPSERKEFEVRASLYHFLNEMQRYLLIKKDLFEQEQKKRNWKILSWKKGS